MKFLTVKKEIKKSIVILIDTIKILIIGLDNVFDLRTESLTYGSRNSLDSLG